MKFVLLLLSLFSCQAIQAKVVSLRTGHYFVDTQREVDLNHFDYVYSIKKVHGRGKLIELYDGSFWKLEPLGPESTSFYAQREQAIYFEYVEDLLKEWKPNELVIFHKITNGTSLLIYNLDRNLILDVTPYTPPSHPSLVIARIETANKIITLSDHSKWLYDFLCCCENWEVGDPILIAKDTPWRGSNTHVLVNLSPFTTNDKFELIPPNRLGVMRVD